VPGSVEELTRVLWRERELLEMLVFKLDVERLLLANGQRRWVAYAAHEAGVVVDTLRQTELLRATAAEAVATEHGRQPDAVLRALAEASPEPWRTILLDHRSAMEAAAAEVTVLAQASRELLEAACSSPGHRRPAHRGTLAVVDTDVEDVVTQAALAAVATTTLPSSLTGFLR
jgi:hypothetical protein